MISKHLLFSGIARRCFSGVSATHKYVPFFSVDLPKNAHVIMPISMDKYDVSGKETKKYDDKLSALLTHTASLLRQKLLSSVTVISTIDMYRLKWTDKFSDEIHRHFSKTHEKLLAEQTHFYQWNELIDLKGRNKFNEYLKLVTKKSEKGTYWYQLMVKEYEQGKKRNGLENALEYKRIEIG